MKLTKTNKISKYYICFMRVMTTSTTTMMMMTTMVMVTDGLLFVSRAPSYISRVFIWNWVGLALFLVGLSCGIIAGLQKLLSSTLVNWLCIARAPI